MPKLIDRMIRESVAEFNEPAVLDRLDESAATRAVPFDAGSGYW
jgi:hypothetical protein